MATVKVVLRRKQRKDGTYPLALRITKGRKTSYVYLGYSCFEKDWDATAQRVRKSHPNAVRLNNLILKKLADANNVVLEVETQDKTLSTDGIKRKIRPEADMLFFARAELFLQRLKDAGNYNCWSPERARVRIFKEFILGTEAIRHELPKRARQAPPCRGIIRGTDVPFHAIDVAVLTQFKIYLKAQRRLSDRTIANYLITIQTIFSQAIREGVIDKKFFPFGKDKVPIRIPESQKVGLSREDVKKLETVDLPTPEHATVRDMWLLSFYFAGMRASDVLQLTWSDFRDGRLHYVMKKNQKPVSLKIPAKAQAILDRYGDSNEQAAPDGFIFPFLSDFAQKTDSFLLKRRIASIIGKCDRILRTNIAPAAGIDGKLSMHISRHTFASLAGDKIPIQMLQKLYRHSNIKTTLGYQANFINQDADEALDAVIGE